MTEPTPDELADFDPDRATMYEAGDPNTPPSTLLTQALAARALYLRRARADAAALINEDLSAEPPSW